MAMGRISLNKKYKNVMSLISCFFLNATDQYNINLFFLKSRIRKRRSVTQMGRPVCRLTFFFNY